MTEFRALVINKTDTGQKVELTRLTEADLMEGDVTIKVEHSSVNYKDGLAITGKAPIARRFPLIPGIDLAGTVLTSDHKDYKPGDKVVLGGWGVGEGHHGGYAEIARVKGDWLVPLPKGLTTSQAMAIGVAGYTAMLCVMALEEQGITPDHGEIIVTGAAGGVGSVSLALLSKLGFKAVGGKLEQNWVVMQNGSTKIGLFQGMFQKNLMTFNPGWSQDRMALERFQDVRELQRALKARGLTMAVEADETTQGPAHFVVTDPDGNDLLFDQHVPSPKK